MIKLRSDSSRKSGMNWEGGSAFSNIFFFFKAIDSLTSDSNRCSAIIETSMAFCIRKKPDMGTSFIPFRSLL